MEMLIMRQIVGILTQKVTSELKQLKNKKSITHFLHYTKLHVFYKNKKKLWSYKLDFI